MRKCKVCGRPIMQRKTATGVVWMHQGLGNRAYEAGHKVETEEKGKK